MQKSLIKKEKELSILCGIQIAVIIFSIDGQPILFGTPDMETKKKEKSIEDYITHRPSEDFESPYLGSLLKLYQGLTKFEDLLNKEIDLTQLNQEIEKHEIPKNVPSSSGIPTNMLIP
ncbi:hypothetical protein H5410_050203 [Solanum commersonii]|uniref:MADS-box domain-containing protein n=1 Tax=Solanum commersonii TaxID=4109 RepID=A0A9J5WX68_SOLCO|nr:hypothetical protein H5410_050203 [Solanum commersonii]